MTGYEIYDEGYEAGYESAMADIMEALYDEDDDYDAANEDLFNFDDLDDYDDAMEELSSYDRHMINQAAGRGVKTLIGDVKKGHTRIGPVKTAINGYRDISKITKGKSKSDKREAEAYFEEKFGEYSGKFADRRAPGRGAGDRIRSKANMHADRHRDRYCK